MPGIVPLPSESINPPTARAVRRRDLSSPPLRYPPEPRYSPLEFYNTIKLADPEQLSKILATDWYFITQDNGAGAPLHFAATYGRVDMVLHLLCMGAPINQRDDRGFTALHRAACLAHQPGYLEIYELLLSRGADPSILSEDYDPYLNPGPKSPADMVQDEDARAAVLELEARYASVPKASRPHPSVGDWWTLYDYGLDAVLQWAHDDHVVFPEDTLRTAQAQRAAQNKALRLSRRAALLAGQEVPPLHTPVVLLFPGQGSQAVGMLKASKHLPAVQAMLMTAATILGYDVAALCMEGPAQQLDDTRYSQPCLLVANLAAAELLKATRPEIAARVSAVAGLSLGEYAALCYAGVLSFEDALRIVKVRAESMAEAATQGPAQGMLSVVGLSDGVLQELCALAKAQGGGEDAVCEIANKLFPMGRVVSGHVDVLERVEAAARERGALKTQMLAVSGAFHTRLMAPARGALDAAMAGATFHPPRLLVMSNVTGGVLDADAAAIPGLLARQVVETVQWERTLRGLIKMGKREMYEVGPGRQIRSMLRRMGVEDVVNVQP